MVVIVISRRSNGDSRWCTRCKSQQRREGSDTGVQIRDVFTKKVICDLDPEARTGVSHVEREVGAQIE